MKDKYAIFYINVPYAQKEAAKAIGARWDAIKKSWYVPKEIPLHHFVQWLPQHLKRPHNPVIDTMSTMARMAVDNKINEHMEFLKGCELIEDSVIGECYKNGFNSSYWNYTNLIIN